MYFTTGVVYIDICSIYTRSAKIFLLSRPNILENAINEEKFLAETIMV